MDICLLCLEKNLGNVKLIRINSDEWNERNYQELIEKHLWPMVSNVVTWK